MTSPTISSSIATAKSELETDGFTIIPDVLSPDVTRAVRDRVLAQAEAEREQSLDFEYMAEAEGDHVNQWVYQLVNKGEFLQQLPLHTVARDLATHMLGPHHLLSAFDAHITYGGNKVMPLHADQWWMPSPQVPGTGFIRQGDIERGAYTTGDPTPSTEAITGPVAVNVMWMITDFTKENGATRFVPRSHLSGQFPDPNRVYDEVVGEGTAGSIVAWDARMWHGAGQNVTDSARVGITTYFCGAMMRQLTNYVYGVRSEVKKVASDEYLALLGFKPFSSYGMTDDPSCDVVRPGDETPGILG
ncbi:MAG: hypothetical protein ACI81L_000498 [Verrucomicrobiales bacterium]|jgi:hypothetical protein